MFEITNYNSVRKSLVFFFTIAITCLLVLIFFLNKQFKTVTLQNEELANLINISGRQRMISQNLTKRYLLLSRNDNPTAKYIKSTDSLVVLFNESHKALEEAVILDQFSNSERLAFMKSLAAIELDLKVMTQVMGESISSMDFSNEESILKSEAQFLPLMDQLTNSFERKAQDNSKRIYRYVERFNIIIAISTCLLGGLVLWITLQIVSKFSRQNKVLVQDLKSVNEKLDRSLLEEEKKVKELDRLAYNYKEAMQKAKVSEETKSKFLATMSHEIRTPMNAIIGSINLLKLQHPYLENNDKLLLLKNNSNHMLSLINDILDYQRIESGNLNLYTKPFNIRQIVEKVHGIWQPSAAEKGLELMYTVDEDLYEEYRGDYPRLEQVLNKLVSNAIKFTEDGMVMLKVEKKDDLVSFSIRDTGIGVSEEMMESIFELFTQEDDSSTQKKGGTGLGLSMSQELVKLMGGKIEVKSKRSFGSTFFFSLPLEAIAVHQNKGKSNNGEDSKLSTVKILLVEDNIGNQAIATGFLKEWNFGYRIANNGVEAIEMIKSKTYDLVLMDLRMPLMNGFDAAKEIRKMEGDYFKQIPIVALSASTFSETKEKIIESGMDDFVSKPFEPMDLKNKILEKVVIK